MLNVSIILATYNRPDTLSAVLQSFCELECEGIQWEILVADNAGGDEAQGVVVQFAEQLPVSLIVESHLGKSNALNAAMAKASGELFLFTDDDVVVDPKWLVSTWEGASIDPHHAVFGGRILPKFPDGIHPENLSIDFSHTRVKGCYAIADSESHEGVFHPWMIFGPNWAMRAELYRQGHRFRTDIGPGTELIVGEETELAYRLHEAGCEMAYLPQSIVYHKIRPEQLSIQWLNRRVFLSGQSWALNGEIPQVPLLFGVPRYLYKSVVIKGVKYLLSFLQSNRDVRFHAGLTYWFEKGYAYQFWKGLLSDHSIAQLPASSNKSGLS